jgi:hypothetical protein
LVSEQQYTAMANAARQSTRTFWFRLKGRCESSLLRICEPIVVNAEAKSVNLRGRILGTKLVYSCTCEGTSTVCTRIGILSYRRTIVRHPW